jgi:DNA-binding NarL/FixJ family response regulator
MTTSPANTQAYVLTDRPGIHILLRGCIEDAALPFDVGMLPLAVETLDRKAKEIAASAFIAVDMLPSPSQSIEICRTIHRNDPWVPLIVHACCPQVLTPEHLRSLGEAGVRAVLGFAMGRRSTARAIDLAIRGGVVLHLATPAPTGDSLAAFLYGTARDAGRSRSPDLTPEEQGVLDRLGEGLTQDQVARVEHLSPRTVSRIVGRLERKLDAPSPFMLGMKAAALGLVRHG